MLEVAGFREVVVDVRPEDPANDLVAPALIHATKPLTDRSGG
jgi:hypothetical protein